VEGKFVDTEIMSDRRGNESGFLKRWKGRA
jgi:hypothetical protein